MWIIKYCPVPQVGHVSYIFSNDMHLAGGVTAKMAQSSSGAAAGEGAGIVSGSSLSLGWYPSCLTPQGAL